MNMEINPRLYARVGGVLYLLIILVGVGEAIAREMIIVGGNASATAANLRSMEWLWRASTAGEFFLLICTTALIPVFFLLLRPVNTGLALLVVCFNVVTVAVEAIAGLHLVSTLFPLGTAAYLQAFTPAQLDAMVYLSIRSHNFGFGIALIFFGCECLVIGHLIRRSGFLPKTIGVLMQLAGISYLIGNFAMIAAPSFANRLFPAILLPALIGEGSLCLWMLIRGVDVEKWHQRALAAATA